MPRPLLATLQHLLPLPREMGFWSGLCFGVVIGGFGMGCLIYWIDQIVRYNESAN